MALFLRRRAMGIALAVSVAVSIAVLPAQPLDAAAPSLFPLTTGATWVRVNEDGEESTTRVAGVKTVGGRRCVVIERKTFGRGRERVSSNCYAATSSELLMLEITTSTGSPIAVTPPRPVMKLPARAGLTWSWSSTGPVQVKVTEKWIGQETVKVRAGTFRAWKLETVTATENVEVTAHTWYAPGVGMVKNERKVRRRDREVGGSFELVSYKVP